MPCRNKGTNTCQIFIIDKALKACHLIWSSLQSCKLQAYENTHFLD